MKFFTGEIHNRLFIGVVIDDEWVMDVKKAEAKLFELETLPNSLFECINMGDKFVEHVKQLLDWAEKKEEDRGSYVYPLSDVTLHAPIPKPTKNIMCVGKNYQDHVMEMGSAADIPKDVMIFTKAPTSVVGHEADILLHEDVTSELDYEGELAIVIGKTGKNIAPEEVHDYIFGYTILNDITARDLQKKHKQFFIGKSLDTTCPMGPYIVHKSVIEDHGALHVETKVNGEVRQSASTELMIFPIEDIVSTLSKGMPLEAGDIIATGTPSGVGKGFEPPKFLASGDQVEVTIEPIGTLSNRVK
ncbi:fumarylacetoacetate hydrolase family protein [Bacillus aerius]|uniref:fumarylacetoacetate hydrolase family protein n=1 Tax=Bacillus aerius TaxID=293388 RepID=UPI00247B5494|nr:fumarylacetoacetate hydrolase family protein [Bacillus aerius]MDH6596368.1 2-keto-4-pentenoate hydratase/2-oxohepta-3-ene-1,7-dioic acid hydratase in catechol pathway [Bacillus aerius]